MKKITLPLTILLLNVACSSTPLLTNAGHIVHREKNKVSTWKALNRTNIIMQEYDYSCGAASLATLMRYYFNDDVTEISIMKEIENIFSSTEMNIIKQKGLSFLELEKISHVKGYQSASVKLPLSALKKLSGPVLVYVEPQGYEHFAIFRGVVEDRVFLADPSRGNIVMSIYAFLKEWNGETFILGKQGFGTPSDHDLAIYHQPGFRKELSTLREVWKTPPNWKAL